MSSCLSHLTKSFNWFNRFWVLYPHKQVFSRYYDAKGIVRASRIDRQYNWGKVEITAAEYRPVAFSAHFALITKVRVPSNISKLLCPKSRAVSKVNVEIAQDRKFRNSIGEAMNDWVNVKDQDLPLFQWWDQICKPRIRKIAMERSKEINHERKFY